MKNPKNRFSEWYSEITQKADLCDLRYNVKGFVVFMPNSVITMKEMYRIYEKELEKRGHKPIWLPALIPESNFKKEGEHVEGFTPQVFWVSHAGKNALEERLAMRPTSETAIYKMFSLWIRSENDLPFKTYHSAQVWRYETRATRPFIRSREFHWIETHNAFANVEDALKQVKEDMELTEEVLHKRFGIPFIFFSRPQWDKFPGADYTFAADTLMPDGKVLQLPSTHLISEKFSKAFGIGYLDKNGERRNCRTTCYGPAISRIYAALISIHGDDRGLVLPFELAPVQVIIVPIIKKERSNDIISFCKKVCKKLETKYRAFLDLSENTPGFKFNKWEMLGAAIRIEVGEKEVAESKVTLVRRDTGEKETVSLKELNRRISAIKRNMISRLRERADDEFQRRIFDAKNIDELNEKIKLGGFVKVPLCTIEMEGKICADKIKEVSNGDVRGEAYGKREKVGGTCVVCGKAANSLVYVARQY
ncbi:MAG: proline--tRNA ligase [Candidatus Anstonellales archaeon]